MTEAVPEQVHHDGLAAALFSAYAATLADDYDHAAPHAARTIPALDREPESTRTIWRAFAARLCAEGVLTLLEAPPGHQPEQAAVTPAVVGSPVVNLRSAVRVLAISVGFLRDPTGALALAGSFTGHQRDDPDREVASAWIMSRQAVAGLLVQIIDAAGAVDPALALELAVTAMAAGQRQAEAVPDSGLYLPGDGQVRP
jgi:hypothetical protein